MTVVSIRHDHDEYDFSSSDVLSSVSSTSSMSDPDNDEEECDEEYLQALKILDKLRQSPVSSSQTRRPMLRKRASVSCLQDLTLSNTSSLNDLSLQRSSCGMDHDVNSESSSAWGHFVTAKRSRPPLCRPPLSLPRSSSSNNTRPMMTMTMRLSQQPSPCLSSGKAC